MWVLILTLIPSLPAAPAYVTTVPGFASLDACDRAGKAWEFRTSTPRSPVPVAVCVKTI